MAERKLTKSEQALKIRDPEAFAERMKRKKGRRPLTAKTIRDAGQGKGKAAKTAMEKRADQAGKKATRQALLKGATPAKAKQVGKKAAMAVVSGSGIKNAINLGMAAANFTPLGKAVKGVGSLIKVGSKSKTPPTKGGSKSKTTPTKGGSKSKLGPSSYTPPQSKALTVTPKKTKVPELSSNQKRAIKATAAVPVVLGANALLKNKPKVAKKPKPVAVKKPKPVAVKKPKPDPSYRDDEGSPIGTVDRKSKPKKLKTLGEAMFGSDQTPRNQMVKNPFTGKPMTLEYDFPEDPEDMKKGGSIKKKMKKGKVKLTTEEQAAFEQWKLGKSKNTSMKKGTTYEEMMKETQENNQMIVDAFNPNKNKGKITISYSNLDEITSIIDKYGPISSL